MHYSKDHPFYAPIKDRYSLCSEGSEKNTYHIVLDLSGSRITYRPGDSIGVFPKNAPQLVSKTIEAMGCRGDEMIVFQKTGELFSLTDFLTVKANITSVSPALVREIALRQTAPKKKELLDSFLEKQNREAFKAYLAARGLSDLLEEHCEVRFSCQELIDHLMPLLPRFYSIASSQREVGDEVHLTISELVYTLNEREKRGVCSHYLYAGIAPGVESVPVFVQPTQDFLLPAEGSADIIMVGPGTGVAPFRAFMQERMALGASGRHWLFFGEQHRAHHFFYEEFWSDLAKEGKLYLDTAFSRDQPEKIYVQHRMAEAAEELFSWIERGAYFYVCGDAEKMAKDVHDTLVRIVHEQGALSLQSAIEYVKELRKNKRYLRDVY